MPIGFKNGTDGNVQVAVDGVKAAAAEHVFFGVDDFGRGAIVETEGNSDCHIILRGGTAGPNFDTASVDSALASLAKAGQPELVMIDCSHANSGKDHIRQAEVATEVAAMIASGQRGISGVMLESFLVAGAQSLDPQSPGVEPLTYGQSVTDKCMDWDATVSVMQALSAAKSTI
jgi:3-deoxy-7-phosphoheptulonate synthase